MKLSEKLEKMTRMFYLIQERHYGLCALAHRLWVYNIDYVEVITYINDNLPVNRIWYNLWNGGYWWKPGEIEPRKKWLEKHIKKLKAKGL